MNDPGNELTSTTRALLERARSGDALPKAHRAVLRRRLAGALGVAAPLAMSTSAAASAALWVARGLAVVGAAGVVHVAVHAGLAAKAAPEASPAIHATVRSGVAGAFVPASTVSSTVPHPFPPPAESVSAEVAAGAPAPARPCTIWLPAPGDLLQPIAET